MTEERSLPGWPKKRLVREVRRHLWHYGTRPTRFMLWQATWNWADEIASSYFHKHWPLPSEIGTQYLLLLLSEMKGSCTLRLPYRAAEHLPPEVAALLPQTQASGVLAIADETGRRPRRARRKSSTTSET
jgi:hypothetical protein